jgi:hypothetical protein
MRGAKPARMDGIFTLRKQAVIYFHAPKIGH